MLARVKRHRHPRIEGEPLQLLAKAQRGREAERPALAVVQSDRRHGLNDHAARGRRGGGVVKSA